ncbi:MAG: hypothetical protein FJ280_03790 [Planctomycetes bacterium]|nr:hypothetical protein [Planctomycetota bacterium]
MRSPISTSGTIQPATKSTSSLIRAGTWPIEIKSGQTFISDYLQSLTCWYSLPNQAHAQATLVYGGDMSYLRQGIAVLSWQLGCPRFSMTSTLPF